MRSADDWAPAQLLGKRVAFKDDEDHAGCWHTQAGIRTGVVVKLGQTLAQKAEILGADHPIPVDLLAPEAEVPRLWVRADPCASFPRGCEAAVERGCLLVLDS
jgi:hypothetical protein